jgi:hypothetical protein
MGDHLASWTDMDVFDDSAVKPVRIGRRPVVAAGNSNGDIQMLRYAGGPARPEPGMSHVGFRCVVRAGPPPA